MIALFTTQELRLGLIGCSCLHEPIVRLAMIAFIARRICKRERLGLILVDDLQRLFFLCLFFEFWRLHGCGFIAARGANKDTFSFFTLWQQ